jgi:type IV secretion system protein VirB10
VSSAAPEASGVQAVRGERSGAMVNAVRSVQSRVSSVLAAGLMIALGLTALTWYYTHALTRRTSARQNAQSAAASRAQGEMALPPLGRIAPPAAAVGIAAANDDVPPAAELPLAEARPPAALTRSGDIAAATGSGVPPDAPAAKTAAEQVRERRLSGDVFTREPRSATALAAPHQTPATVPSAAAAIDQDQGDASDGRHRDLALATLLRPTAATAVQAQTLPTERFMLPKGAFIDCTLETAIDSTLPGMTTCITAADTFGADGKVVLLERGSKLVGETRGQVQRGQARVFVVWTQARTPSGVIVPLDSPGTDELGRAGLPGEVNRHFWERFGAAMLISVVNGAVQAGVQAANHSGGAVLYAPSASQDVLTEVLKDSVQIPPTIVKRNGDRIEVLVARDLDFRSVYELRMPVAGR